LGVQLIVLEASSGFSAPYATFTLVNTRHNYPVPWKNWYSKGYLEYRDKYEICVSLVGCFLKSKNKTKKPKPKSANQKVLGTS